MKLLVVEPDKLLAATYMKVLEEAGHTAQHAHSAQGAIHQLDQQTPDVIVLEVQMTNHNGVEFLYELRSYPEWQTIPVIINSFVPKRQLPIGQRLHDLGVVDYLYKPTVSLQRLVTVVSRHQPIAA